MQSLRAHHRPTESESVFFKKILFIYFLERGGGREKERETSSSCLLDTPQLGTEPATQAFALTGN